VARFEIADVGEVSALCLSVGVKHPYSTPGPIVGQFNPSLRQREINSAVNHTDTRSQLDSAYPSNRCG